MARYIHEGRLFDHTPATDITAGDVIAFGSPGYIGIAPNDIATGEKGAVQVRGVGEFPKAGGTDFVPGDTVQWSGTAMIAATSGAVHGTVIETTATGATTVLVDFSPDYVQVNA